MISRDMSRYGNWSYLFYDYVIDFKVPKAIAMFFIMNGVKDWIDSLAVWYPNHAMCICYENNYTKFTLCKIKIDIG